MAEIFYLVRHGERESAYEDTQLTEKGVEQAGAAGREIVRRGGASAVYSSPLPRAMQTAGIIAKELGQEVIVDNRLLERIRWGDRQGETYEDFLAEWQKTVKDRDYRPENGDSSRENGKRIKALLDEIRDGQKVVIVTHNGSIWDFLKNEFVDGRTDIPEYLANPHRLAFCSITEISRKGNQYDLVDFNSTSHLPIPITM